MRCKTKNVKNTNLIAKWKNDMPIIVISGSTVARLVTVSTRKYNVDQRLDGILAVKKIKTPEFRH